MKKQSQKQKKKKSQKKNAGAKKGEVLSPDAGSVPKKAVKPKTPVQAPKKAPEKKRGEEPFITRYIGVAGRFLREARMELKKVKWPTRKELLASTAVVIVLTLVVAFFLGLVDFGLIKIIRNIVG